MFNYKTLLVIFLCAFSTIIFADLNYKDYGTPKAKRFLEKIIEQNNEYINGKGPAFFLDKEQGQKPIVTMVCCSDSRVQTDLIDKSPEGDLFIIRNIGNQLETARGSVEYGVNHLHTEILLILGHSGCGAIDAANSDYTNLEPGIIKELANLDLKKGMSNIEGVKANVNYQVSKAMEEYSKLVSDNKLLIVGAVYDFSDDMHKGAGKFNIINIQGKNVEEDVKKLH